MTSFQIGISPSRRAAGRFISRVRRALQRAVVEEGERTGLNQSKIAEAIGVHRSVISRELNGRQDITLGRIAELAWAMGREIEFSIVVPEEVQGSNVNRLYPGALRAAQPAMHAYPRTATAHANPSDTGIASFSKVKLMAEAA
jgi:plasmid maintenance system antidote protein VapI